MSVHLSPQGQVKEKEELPEKSVMFSDHLPNTNSGNYGHRLNSDPGQTMQGLEHKFFSDGRRRKLPRDLICYWPTLLTYFIDLLVFVSGISYLGQRGSDWHFIRQIREFLKHQISDDFHSNLILKSLIYYVPLSDNLTHYVTKFDILDLFINYFTLLSL